MKCEVVREGQACSNDAEVLVRTPWATQLACSVCAQSFKRYETQRIDEFTCDWSVGGKECGEKAAHYFEGDGFQRPLCVQHMTRAKGVTGSIIDTGFNPKLVPYKPPVQPQPRVVLGGEKAGLWCWCGKSGRYRGGAESMPLCDEHWTPTPKTEPPLVDLATSSASTASVGDVQAALKDLALTAIQTLKEKIIKWAK